MAVVEEGEEKAAAPGADFLPWLGPDTSGMVFALLDDPADIGRAAAVSRSWRAYVMGNHLSKMRCLRTCPEVASVTRVEQAATSGSGTNDGCCSGASEEDAAASAAATAREEDHRRREHKAYLRLAHALLTPRAGQSCIARAIGASSTDLFPEESIRLTLNTIVRDGFTATPVYWSSSGKADTEVPEFLLYKLCSDLCLVHEILIRPFQAHFQPSHPIYSSRFVRFRMGCPKRPLRPEDLVSNKLSDKHEGLTADDNYIWTYTSPKYKIDQMNTLQSFKLSRPALCIGGVLKIELLERMQIQASDGLYYICVSQVRALGCPLPRDLGVTFCSNDIVLKYSLGPETQGDDGQLMEMMALFD